MKTNTSLVAWALIITNSAISQVCVPDPSFTSPGIYPDSATGIPPATEGIHYEIVITVIVPADSVVDIFGNPQLVTIDSIVLKKILNKPTWMSYDCHPAKCQFPGGGSGCAKVQGTPPGGSAGSYPLDIIIGQHGKVQPSGFPVSVFDTLYAFYSVQVLPGTGIQAVRSNSLRLGNVSVPHHPGDLIEIMAQQPETVTLTVYDMTGRAVTEWLHASVAGRSYTAIPDAGWSPGVYALSLTGKDSRMTRNILIAR